MNSESARGAEEAAQREETVLTKREKPSVFLPGRRFDLPYITAHSPNHSTPQSFFQSDLLDDASSSSVDHDRAGFHRCELLRSDEMARRSVQRAVDREDVHEGEKIGERGLASMRKRSREACEPKREGRKGQRSTRVEGSQERQEGPTRCPSRSISKQKTSEKRYGSRIGRCPALGSEERPVQ